MLHRRLLPLLALPAAFLLSSAAATNPVKRAAAPARGLVSISQTLARMKDETAFFSALEAAKVEALLDGPANFKFTVFAPTNEAFEKLKSRGYGYLFEPANIRKLRAVMSFHMVASRYLKSELRNGQELKTSHGTNNLKVIRSGERIWLSGGTPEPIELQTADVLCDNGVIHVIGDVLLPLAPHEVPAAHP